MEPVPEARPRRVGHGERPGPPAHQGRRRLRHQRPHRAPRGEGRPDGRARDSSCSRSIPASTEAAVQRAEASLASAKARRRRRKANLLQAQRNYERSARDQEDQRHAHLRRAARAAQDGGRGEQGARTSRRSTGRPGDGVAPRRAQHRWRRPTIFAPMSGRVTRLNVEEGETAVPGTFNKDAATLLTIADMSVLETKVKVDETDVARITRRRLGGQSRSTPSPTRRSSAASSRSRTAR